jgi:oligosaccharide repeat unit polymerase
MVETALTIHLLFYGVAIFYLATRGYLNLYSGLLIYAIFHFIAFVQRPLLVHLFELTSVFERMGHIPTDGEFIHTLFVVDLGFVSFIVAYLAALRFEPIKPNFITPEITHRQRSAFMLAFLLLLPLILYSVYLALTMRQVYGVQVLDELAQLNLRIDPATGAVLYVDTTGYIVEARNFALPFATFFIVMQRGKWWSCIPLLLLAFTSLQVGARWPLVISVLVQLLVFSYLRKRVSFKAKHYAIMGLVLFAFVLVGHNRDAFVKFLETGTFDVNFDLRDSSFGEHPDFAMFDFVTFVLAKVPDVSKTYSYFTQYLGLFTQPIPRMLWPDKPVNSPIVLVNLDAYGNFSSYVTTLVGDGWISLGYFGVMITTGVVGWFYGWLYRRFCSVPPSIYFFCGYFWILALLLQWARDGNYYILDTFFFFSLSPLAMAYALERVVFTPRPALRRRHLQ